MAIAEAILDEQTHGSLRAYRRAWAASIDGLIGRITEPVAAILVLVEVLILASGVFTRYVLKQPLVWTDELATFLFLWLAVLVAVGAYRHSGHRRLSSGV